MLNWLEMMRPNVELFTFAGYQVNIERRIAPYFRETGITLAELKAADIQNYYQYLMAEKGVSANTVIHYHANIRKALQHAMKTDLIPINPADKVQRPTKQKFVASFLNAEELNKLLNGVRGHRLELAVILGAFYGLRREEVVGLKWSAIDFRHKCITINHTVTQANVDGKRQVIEKDCAKNESSRRSLPLVSQFEVVLLELMRRQESYRQVCGRSYNTEFLDYIYVDELGNRIRPDTITTSFPKLLAQLGIRRVRFHDLRHSCASLLLANGISMKEIQEWLGHSDFSTTADIYSHLDYNSKVAASEKMDSCLTIRNSKKYDFRTPVEKLQNSIRRGEEALDSYAKKSAIPHENGLCELLVKNAGGGT